MATVARTYLYMYKTKYVGGQDLVSAACVILSSDGPNLRASGWLISEWRGGTAWRVFEKGSTSQTLQQFPLRKIASPEHQKQ